MLLYRVLNKYDMLYNPLENGLASKKLLYNMTYDYLNSTQKEYLSKLSKNKRELYVKNNIEFYINEHKKDIGNKILKRGNKVYSNLSGIHRMKNLTIDDINNNYYETILKQYNKSWLYLSYYLSTINNHLINGSKTFTNWISTTKNINKLIKYYNDTSKIAIIKTTSMGLMDNNTLVVDMSNMESINEMIMFLSKKIEEDDFKKFYNISKENNFNKQLYESYLHNKTNENFMGYKYSSFDEEFLIYEYYPKENIVCTLDKLQIDLLGAKLFDLPKYASLPKDEQVRQLAILKEVLSDKIKKIDDPFLMEVYKRVYIDNESMDFINVLNTEKINNSKLKILKIASKINNIQIKK